jgi:hypothetical protein
MTLPWTRGERTLAGSNLESFDRVIAARGDQRIVLNAGWLGANTPVSASQRAQFCGYVRSTLDRYPQIHDVVIWNEVNKTMFFRPQFTRDGKPASPALYEKLLATCYDALHALRGSDVNVITSVSPRGNDNPRAISNVSLSPVTFIRELGRAYRASGRRKPIFDTWGQNAYGASSSEPASKRHAGGTISQGDYGKLLATIKAAFRRTRQPLPSATGRVRIWYLETGFQTSVDGALPGAVPGQGERERALPGCAGPAAERGDRARVLPAGGGGALQLRARRRPCPGGLAVWPPLGKLDAEAVVRDGARRRSGGERRHASLRLKTETVGR